MTLPNVVAAATIGAGLMLPALVWLWPRLSARPRRRSCRWQRQGQLPDTRFVRWSCRQCGVEVFALGKRAPRECKRAARSSGL
jgi:hypothetical protein